MSKSLTLLMQVVCALALLVPAAHDAAARPSSSSSSSHSSFSPHSSSSSSGSKSFSSGFSSRKASSSSPSAPPSSFSAPSSSASPAKPSGGFGSFGKRASTAAPQQSDSATSRQMTRQQSEANALRTLDERRAQPAGTYSNAPAPAPVQPSGAPTYVPMPAPMPAQAPPVIVHQDSGIGGWLGGYVLGRMAGNHGGAYHQSGYPGSANNNGAVVGTAGAPAAGGSWFGGFIRLFAWLCVLSLIGWGLYFAWKRMQRRREENKPNYSFQRRG